MTTNDTAHQLFKALPLPCLLLKADAPHFTIVDANEAYLQLGKLSLNTIVSKPIFSVFHNYLAPDATKGLADINASLHDAITTKLVQNIATPILNAALLGINKFENTYCALQNIPLCNQTGEVDYVVLTVKEIATHAALQQPTLIDNITQKVAEVDDKYWLLFHKSPIPKWVYDIETLKIIEVNEAAIAHYGYTHNEFLQLTIKDLSPTEEIPKLLAFISKLNEKERLVKIGKFIHKKKNGKHISVEKSSVLLNYHGKNCTLVIANDISDVEYAIKELATSIERYHYVSNATFDAIWDWEVTNHNKNHNTYLGEGFETIFAYRVHKMANNIRFLVTNIHPDDKHKVLAAFFQLIKGNNTQAQAEYRFKKADGTYAYIVNKVFAIKNNAGKTIRMVGAIRDITIHKNEFDRLQLLQSVITHTSDMVLITEAESTDGLGPRIVYANEAYTSITGYTLQEIIGNTPRILQGPKTDRQELNKLKASLIAQQPCSITVINYKKNGEEFWTSINVSPVINSNGKLTHWIAIKRDVTAEKLQQQNTLKAIVKAQEDERFEIGSELHDNVCQILATTKVSFKMLEKNIRTEDAFWFQQGIEQIGMVFKEVRNLSHRLAPTFFADTSLEKCLSNLVKTFNLEEDYNMTIAFDNSFKSHTTTKDFQLNMYRILQEQLRNIVKYSGAKNITISGITTSNSLKMMIQDDGIGFNPQTIKSGIGLANMKRRTELFGGKLSIESALGKGCTISVEVPLTEVQ